MNVINTKIKYNWNEKKYFLMERIFLLVKFGIKKVRIYVAPFAVILWLHPIDL